MTIYQGEQHKNYKITEINTNDPQLKNRFRSFGFVRGAIINILETAPKRLTISLLINNTKIALRDEEAMIVEIIEADA